MSSARIEYIDNKLIIEDKNLIERINKAYSVINNDTFLDLAVLLGIREKPCDSELSDREVIEILKVLNEPYNFWYHDTQDTKTITVSIKKFREKNRRLHSASVETKEDGSIEIRTTGIENCTFWKHLSLKYPGAIIKYKCSVWFEDNSIGNEVFHISCGCVEKIEENQHYYDPLDSEEYEA